MSSVIQNLIADEHEPQVDEAGSLTEKHRELAAVRRVANQDGDRGQEMALQQWEGEGGAISES